MNEARLTVIGGGFTGAMVVMNALRAVAGRLAITIVEPNAELGRGVAYGTTDPAHRINVPSDRMGLFKDDPAGATNWFRKRGLLDDPASDDGQGQFYVPREAYGHFMADQLRQALHDAGERVRFEHRRARAVGLRRHDAVWEVALDDGNRFAADCVALCFGHATPALPGRIAAAARAHPGFVPDPWAPRALSAVGPDDSVLIVGTGLTMADVVASLLHVGHRGPVTAISRRGLLPRSHGAFRGDFDVLAGEPPPTTALALLRLVRRRLRESAEREGWHPIMDGVRFKLPVLWAALAPAEKHRVIRSLLPFWEVHRFRIAPQIQAALTDAMASGQLTVQRAALRELDIRDGRLLAGLTRPGGRREDRAFDAVALCTGPEKDLRRNTLVGALLAAGIASLDDTGLSLAVDASARVRRGDGGVWSNLLAFGPITRGSFGEMTGAPDIAAYLERLAPLIGSAITAGEPT